MGNTTAECTARKLKDKVCYCCGKIKGITIHHLRDLDFKTKRNRGKFNGYILLCRRCHDFVEKIQVTHKLDNIQVERIRKETKQKIIEEFKEIIDRYADKWQKVNTDLCEKKIISVVAESRQRNWIQTFCRELKSQVDKGEKLCQ